MTRITVKINANKHHLMQRTRSSCYDIKKRNMIFYQVKIGRNECGKIVVAYKTEILYSGVETGEGGSNYLIPNGKIGVMIHYWKGL